MTWSEFHTESEKLASEAQILLRQRNYPQAAELYKHAAELEEKALSSLQVSKERTRGITAVSAVAL